MGESTIDSLLPNRDATFKRRLQAFAHQYDNLLALNLAVVAEGHDFINALADANRGREVVSQRKVGTDGFKAWDPTILKVDKDTENAYISRMEESGKNIIVLSEELEKPKHLNETSSQALIYGVCDPFDGSYLFEHRIPVWWFSSLAFYSADGKPLSCVVCDPIHGVFNFADNKKAYTTELRGNQLGRSRRLDSNYRRELLGRDEATDIDPKKTSIESYALKPEKFLKPLYEQYGGLLSEFKFFNPNGGPDGFGDIARGKIDVYFAPRQPHVDIFSGLPLALNAGCQVADFDGNPVMFTPEVHTLHDVVVTSTPELMEKMLAKIAQYSGRPKKEIWGR